jgi:predicted NBD/HSP70 family sugar kinase
MANLNTILNPQTIILTGGVARYHKLYLSEVKQIIKDYSFTANQPRWRIGHDQKAGALGASLLIK